MKKISIAQVRISSVGKKLVNSVLNSNRLTYGRYTEKFEEKFAKLHDRTHAVFVNSGTSALQIGLHAMKEYYGWRNGDEVLIPAVTFVASANVVIHNSLTPVFVDVEKDYYEIEPKEIIKKITKKTRAIMPVHLFGQPCQMDNIMEIAQKYNLRVIEDSCETLFTKFKGKPAGSFGDIGCYSTYVAHILSTGVGGLATCDSKELAILMQSLSFHGRDHIYLKIEDDDRKNSKKLIQVVNGRFSFPYVGYSYRLTEMESALGLGELKHWKSIISKRQQNAAEITKILRPFENSIQLPKIRNQAEHCFMLYPIVVKDPNVSRDDLVFFLEKHGIETRPMMPLVNQPAYIKRFGNQENQYPISKWINEYGFVIGCHQHLHEEDIKYIGKVFKMYFSRL